MMKKLLLSVALLMSTYVVQAQESYTVNGETLILQKEAEGTLTLLWNANRSNYRYFIKKGTEIVELKNTLGMDQQYKQEYKQTLEDLTGNENTQRVKFVLYSLKDFVDAYNKSQDSSYVVKKRSNPLATSLAVIGGITNNPFVTNPDNKTNLFLRAEFEVSDQNVLPSHSLVLGAKHSFKSDAFDYSATQLSLNYRYKIINAPKFNVFANLNIVTYNNFSSNLPPIIDGDGEEIIRASSGSNFNAPLILGIGANFRVAEGQYITFTSLDMWGLNADDNGQFPVNIGLGYRFAL
ncbi:hypothetical protein ACFQ1M_16705 [Sungkyunkwania multivorans]|uniref:Outer membrane protein beta-barrel domain-containing protein n=1 Tax=Sungkyunkwania multivorans TaxID=1173618 RepID=A0ABW3D1L5_9FLAO